MGMRELGAYIAQQREARSLSQERVAEAAGIARSYVSKIEAGEPKGLGVEVLRNIAGALGTDQAILEGLLYDRPAPRLHPTSGFARY